MSILINKHTRLLVQGITSHEGMLAAQKMIEFHTTIVAGVTPGRGGEWVLDGKVPIFDYVNIAIEATGANASVVFVPARFAPDAIYEVIDAGIPLIICITEGIPVQEMMRVCNYLDIKGGRLIGPNTPGVITPGEAIAGIIPADITIPGSTGIVSRSSTLTYEVLYALKRIGIGTSTCVGIGGDQIVGTNFIEVLEMFEADPHTDQIVLIGEIGGTDEEEAADFIVRQITKPVVALIAGQTAPTEKMMGHAGAIIQSGSGSAGDKIEALQTSGVRIAKHPEEIPQLLSR